jgi:hypothetical protein
MTRIARTALLGALALAVGAVAYASEPAQTSEGTPGQATSPPGASGDASLATPPNAAEGRVWTEVKGEVIDVFCYLDRGFTGEIHRECAQICIRGGMPMGILTQEGEIYLVFPSNEWATDRKKVEYRKPYERLIEWAARQVQVGGYLVERQGMKGIEVYESKLLQQYLLPEGGLDSTSVMPDSTGSERP